MGCMGFANASDMHPCEKLVSEDGLLLLILAFFFFFGVLLPLACEVVLFLLICQPFPAFSSFFFFSVVISCQHLMKMGNLGDDGKGQGVSRVAPFDDGSFA